MGSSSAMLKEARSDLGLAGRPNKITREYAAKHGDDFLRAAWCNMAITYWARHSGNAAAVLLGGDRAYTVYHAQDFQKADRWYSGTAANLDKAKPGDIVFFDWGQSNSIGAIDHIGVVEVALGGGRVQTIEGNTGDAVKRKVRSSNVVAGYGRPPYSGGSPGSNETEAMVRELPMLRKGAKAENEHVQSARGLLYARSHPEIGKVVGAFDDKMDKAVREVQKWGKVEVDGVIGPDTWAVLLRVH
jgi:hypothetical protein